MAVHLARYRNNPDVAHTGLWNMPKLRLYTSEEVSLPLLFIVFFAVIMNTYFFFPWNDRYTIGVHSWSGVK